MTTSRETLRQTSTKVRRAVQTYGASETARRLGLSRGAVLALAAGNARAGTYALAQTRIDAIAT